MASELLKNRALIQKLKEPEVPTVKFDLTSTGFEELFTLPEPKPQELLDIQEENRKGRLLDTLNKIGGGLMDESVDFIERKNFARGVEDPRFDPEMTLPELKAAGIKSKNKYKLEGKYGKTGYAYLAPEYDALGNKTGKFKTMVFPTDAAREKFIKSREKIANVKRADKSKAVAEREKIQKNVNNWIKDWFNKNNKKFKLGQYDEAMSKLKEDWAKEVTKDKYKTEKFKGRTLTSPKGFPVFKDITLEGLIGTDPARSGLERSLSLGRTMDTTEPFYKKSFHNFILKNDPKLRKDIKSFMTWATKDKRGAGKQALLLEASNTWLKNNDAVNFMGEVDDLVLDKLKRGEILRKYFPKITDSYMNKIYKIDNFRKQTISKLEKLAGVEQGYINYNLRKDLRDIRRIFNVDKLPLALRYSGDHIIGLKEAELLNDKAIAKQVIDNVVGKTFQQNTELGGLRFGRQRRDLTREFVNKKTTLDRKNQIVNYLNEMTEKYMPGELEYSIGNKNNLVIKTLKPQQLTQADRFKSYFEAIDKTKEGKAAIKEQYGSLNKLLKSFDNQSQKKLTALQKLASGKNFGFDPILLTKAGFEEFIKPGAKIATKGAATLADLAISAGKGGTGLAVGALLEADPIITGMSEGKDFGQTARDTFIGSAIDAIPGVNLGSLNEDLIKLADTEEQRVAIQNLIDYQKDYARFTKDLGAFRSYSNLDQVSLEELGFTASDLVNMENQLAKRFEDIQTRAPKVYNPEAFSLVRELATKEAEKRKANLEGIQGAIFGDRMAKDPDFIENQIQQILAASTGAQGATDSYTDNYRFLPQEQLSPEELDERFDMEGGIMAANGGRIGFADGPKDPKRRLFLKIMGGIASLPIFSKFLGKSEVAKPVVKLAGTTTKMPDWFPDFVNKMMFSTGGKKVDADLMEYTTPELPGVKMTRSDEGEIIVEGKNAYGEPYEIIYRPPGYELIDETTGKAVKIPGEFKATDTQFRRVGPEGDDFDVDFEVVDDVEQILGGDSTKLEGFAKGTKKDKYTIGQQRVDEADQLGERADEFTPYGDVDPTDFADE
jgi:hypothetical protein